MVDVTKLAKNVEEGWKKLQGADYNKEMLLIKILNEGMMKRLEKTVTAKNGTLLDIMISGMSVCLSVCAFPW